MSNFISDTKHTMSTQGGFTIIEVTMSTALFIVAILIVIGALVSLQSANAKVRSTRIATDNVGAAIDSMSRAIRMGGTINCGCVPNAGVYTTPRDCPMTDGLGGGGDICIAFESQKGNPALATDQYLYRLTGGRIERSTDSGVNWLYLTAPEITINTLRFYAKGTTVATDQPYVTMVVRGNVSPNTKQATNFNTQVTISPRTPNLNLTP